ncbi:hypothetical protein WOSG25_160240 [Weissella oryzae SG25]|uniref:Uncharacterized protein n=1 Tax=Weissella oryzae (strain DSM 25784 / JCM 18191 / LMG 30913 / SG25) TaxID=1329250 RepID=A0A069CWJ9_WEIOS|nr:hypothetical protein [Weissella oryzae]GAK31809.1 hypothetical protein WOSG25_160240 [Weissella oryzae SG25]
MSKRGRDIIDKKVVLEAAAQEFSNVNKLHPRIYEFAPKDVCVLVEEVQFSPVNKYNVDVKDTMFPTAKWGDIPVRFIRPAGTTASYQ